MFIYDAATHALEWRSGRNMFGGHAWTGIHDVKIGDVDDDGEQEILVATDKLYDGAIYVINATTHKIEQSYLYDDGAPIYSIAIADVDNDGQTEIIAGPGREHTGAPGVYVYVINGSTGAVEWHSIHLGDYWSEVYAVEVGDIDNDGVPEIVAINNNIFVFDGISHQQWQSTLGGCYGLDLGDIDGDGIKEIIVGTSTGNIIAIDGQTHAEELNVNVSSSAIVGLRSYDIDGDGQDEIAFAGSGSLGVYDVHGSRLLWQSGTFGYSAGDYNSLVVSNFDSDGLTEMLIGTNYTVVEFKGGGPVIERLRPRFCEPGDVIRIKGFGFGETQGDSVVHIGKKTFDSSSPRIKLWSDTKVKIRIPNYNCEWFRGREFRRRKVWVTVETVDSNKKPLKIMKPDRGSGISN